MSGQTSEVSDKIKFDGPAELPREYVKSSLEDSPARGKTWTVHDAEELKDTLTRASCGDVIELQAGAVFSGTVTLPAKNCDDLHWIIIRTSAPDSALPPENTRLTPCYAGVASLPGRPHWNCPAVTNVLAKIQFGGSGGSGPILFSPGANHYRFIGLEITALANAYNLVEFLDSADHVVFDRVWMHGTAQGEAVRGILLGQSRYIAVVDSFFTDFHCIAKTGTCGDTQAIAGGIGDGPMGPYKIVNNFLEASGENVIFGGGGGTATPQDIEVRHNHMFKPLIWMKGQSGYVGGKDGNPFITKNLFELKNAQRVLLEGNIMENTWGGFTQVGFGIVLTPRNPGGCAPCKVTDVTIRYNYISHVGAGIQIANALSNYGAALDGQRYSIHDIVIDDIDGGKYDGPGELAQISVNPGAPLLQNLKIDHITAFPAHSLFVIGDFLANSGPMKNFVFTNNIVSVGTAPVWSTGGGPANCAFHDEPRTTFSTCFAPATVEGNVIVDAPPAYGSGSWPPHNFFAKSSGAVKFIKYSGGDGGDYHLQPSSPYKGNATDGKDIGADVDAIHVATAGAD
ncbi:MAG TPA: hypothetical protein VMF10_06535 [Candidatus Aquilonibacter sp.]|nr:hypothetical protein [Candidatus Aquilonibacter sp.]